MTNVPAFQGLGYADGMLKMMGFIESFNDVLDGTLEATLEMEDAASRLCYIEASRMAVCCYRFPLKAAVMSYRHDYTSRDI
jgi:hypothetical protein